MSIDNLLATFSSSTTVETSNRTAHFMLAARQQVILALILHFSEELPFNRPSQSDSACQLHRHNFTVLFTVSYNFCEIQS
jgi:hypothetical protein